MNDLLNRLKPGVPVRVHIVLAATIWSVVGFFLMVNGYLLVHLAGREWLTLAGLVLGTAKAWLLLDRVARKNLARLAAMPDGRCIGSVYSVRTWLLVGCMIVLGRFLRHSHVAPEIIGLVYFAVGWGLFLASRLVWRRVFVNQEDGGRCA